MKLLLIFFMFLFSTSLAWSVDLIPNFNYGVLPTNVDMNMFEEDYTFSIALLGIVSAFAFWIGWNSHT